LAIPRALRKEGFCFWRKSQAVACQAAPESRHRQEFPRLEDTVDPLGEYLQYCQLQTDDHLLSP
jgi:hypothetical protein